MLPLFFGILFSLKSKNKFLLTNKLKLFFLIVFIVLFHQMKIHF